MSVPLSETLLPLELNAGEGITLERPDGSTVDLRLIETGARVLFTTLPEAGVEFHSARTFYAFFAVLEIGGERHRLEREVPTWRSFYEPWVAGGLRIWLDAVQGLFSFLLDPTGTLAPQKEARLAVQAAEARICPEPIHPWCPLRRDGLRIGDCYTGEMCWLGPYHGVVAHDGLDLNHRSGTYLTAPLSINDHYLFSSLARGDANTCWRGHRRWPDGAEWILECHNLGGLTVREHTPLNAGRKYALGAGVSVGAREHTHFAFRILRDGREYPLDPWILFWQAYQDREANVLSWSR